MTLENDINALPTTIGDGHTRHLNDHQVIHTALKDHQSRLSGVEGRVPDSLKLSLDTSVGTRVMAGNLCIMGKTDDVDMAGLFDPAPNGGKLFIQRTNNFITVLFDYFNYSPGVTASAQIPEGFRPARQSSGVAYRTNGQITGRWQFLSSGKLTVWWEQNYSAISQFTLPSEVAWPTSLTVGGA